MQPPVQVIILAAGKSSRLYPLTLNRPKSLLEFGSDPLLVRTIRQLHEAGFTSIRVVVGHLKEQIKSALANFEKSITFVDNERYETDTNSLSLCLGLQNLQQDRVLVIESDVVFSDTCWPIIKDICTKESTVWFTHGKFLPHQKGGIIKSDNLGKVLDMKIVPRFNTQYEDYSKNLGIVYIGPYEVNRYKMLLEKMVAKSTAFYYMEYWIQYLSDLACREVNLFSYPACSFNTLAELEYCRKYLNGCV